MALICPSNLFLWRRKIVGGLKKVHHEQRSLEENTVLCLSSDMMQFLLGGLYNLTGLGCENQNREALLAFINKATN